MDDKGLVSFSAFAKLVGVSPQRVSQAAKAGKISFEIIGNKKLVDPVAGKKEWAANKTSHARNLSGLKKSAKKNKKVKKIKKKPTKTKVAVKPEPVPTYDGMTTADADRKKKVFEAKLAELKFSEQAGELIKIVDVKREAFALARGTRDAVLSLPARIAHEIAAETDPRQSELLLLKELTKVLQKLIEEKING